MFRVPSKVNQSGFEFMEIIKEGRIEIHIRLLFDASIHDSIMIWMGGVFSVPKSPVVIATVLGSKVSDDIEGEINEVGMMNKCSKKTRIIRT